MSLHVLHVAFGRQVGDLVQVSGISFLSLSFFFLSRLLNELMPRATCPSSDASTVLGMITFMRALLLPGTRVRDCVAVAR